MCTAITTNKRNRLFARNLDVEKSYGQDVIITPRAFTLSFRKSENIQHHYAMIGAGIIERGYPLYFDGANEHGLAMAGLNFVGNAKYEPPKENKLNITPFEFIPYILGKCKSIKDCMLELKHINLTAIPFSKDLALAELHWIIADKTGSIVVEQSQNGLKVYDNPTGVLTNNPPFPFHLQNLNNYIGLSSSEPSNTFSPEINLAAYSNGMGGLGMPGDLSSASRFVRATFNKFNSCESMSTEDGINQMFHILSSTEQCEGAVRIGEEYEKTDYSSVINLDTLTYYYRTYSNSQITAVRLFSENLDASSLISYPFLRKQNVMYQNR